MKKLLPKLALLGAISLIIIGCQTSSLPTNNDNVETATRPANLDQVFQAITSRHKIASAGAAIIKDGKIVWTGYTGEQAPGIPSSKDSLFNVGSITKTVTAEMVLRLREAGKLSLNEPMSAYWVDPDIVADQRHKQLTPQIALSHKTGFLNSRYADKPFKLRFVADPAERFGYSGEGYDYVARFVVKKLGKDFDALVSEHVLTPLDMKNTSVSIREWVFPRLVQPVGIKGLRHKPFCNGAEERWCAGIGDWSAADEMVTTIEDYARFMISVMNGNGVGDDLQKERFSIQTSTANDAILACPFENKDECPLNQGYGLGWEIFEFADSTIVSHGGSDWSERAMAYFDPDSRDGLIVFLNGPSNTSVEALIEALEGLDPGSKIAAMYRGWVIAYESKMTKAGVNQ